MKTDYHCHILPGLDDGTHNIESVYLFRKLFEWGYTDAICVVHSSYKYRHTPQEVLTAYGVLFTALKTVQIDLNDEQIDKQTDTMKYIKEHPSVKVIRL